MSLKLSLQGGLIYLTLLYVVITAIILLVNRKKKSQVLASIATGFWVIGFITAVISVTWRGIHVGHPPMQNLFEFFLCMAAVLAPLSWWNWKQHGLDTRLKDAFLGILILFPAGFVMSEEVRTLPPALQSPLFVPHVASYVAGYVMMARAALMALPLFRSKTPPEEVAQIDLAVRQSVSVGFLLVTIGLLLGALWGKLCWSSYWQWDPKETWSLATWLVYGAYFHHVLLGKRRSMKVSAGLLWLGLVFIVLTITWINLSRLFSGMHTYA